MSVLVPDHKVFSYIHSGMRIAATRTTCDAKYSHVIRSHFQHNDLESESKRLVKSWLLMCEQSFNAAYNDTGTTADLLKLKPLEFTPIQLLKYLQCVSYNIEKPGIETPQQFLDFALLKKWVEDLTASIVAETHEYKNAKWSDI